MAITFTKGGSTITPEYQPAQVYGREPRDKVLSVAFDDATFTEAEVGAAYGDPVAFDGEGIVIERPIRSVTLVDDGTGSATTQTGRATSGGSGTGLTVDLTAAAGVVTAVAINNQGDKGYKLGELITVTNSTADDDPTFRIGLLG